MANAAKTAQQTADKIEKATAAATKRTQQAMKPLAENFSKLGQGLKIEGIGGKFADLGNKISGFATRAGGALGKVGGLAAKAGTAVKAGMAVAASATVAAVAVIVAGVAGAVAAFAAITIKAAGLAQAAAPIQGLRASFNALTKDIAGGSAAMLTALQQASAGMITNTELMQKFNLASQLVSNDFAQTLPSAMEMIGKVAQSTGQDFDFLLNSYVTAAGRLSPMIADNMAITVDSAQAYSIYADEIGKTVEALTKQEKQTAFTNEMLRQLEKNTASLPPVFGSAQQVFKSFGVTMQNIRDDVGMDLLPTFTELYQLFNRFTPALRSFGQGFAGAFAGIFQVGKSFVKGLARSLGVDFDAMANNSEQWGANIVTQLARGMAKAIGAVIQVLQVLGQAIAGWLAPGSPPALLPDLPNWGQSAGEWFLKGMANANVNILRDLSRNVESFIRSTMSGSTMQEIATAVLAAREAIFGAVSGGDASSVLGALPPELQSYAASLIAVEQAAQGVAAAQEQVAASQNAVTAAQNALNAVTKRYEGILAPISARLSEIQKERDDFVKGMRRTELEQIIADATAAGDTDAVRFAQLELEELDLQDQVAEVTALQTAEEAQAQAAIDAAEQQLEAGQAALDLAQAAQDVAEQQLQIQQEMLAHLIETNNLLADSQEQLTETGAAAGGAAGGVGSLTEALGELGAGGASVAGSLGQTMSDLAASIMGEFAGVAGQAETLGATWGRVFNNAKLKFAEVVTNVRMGVVNISQFFLNLITNIEELKTAWRGNVDLMKVAWGLLKDRVREWGLNMSQSVLTLIGKLQEGRATWEENANLMKTAWGLFKDNVASNINAVKDKLDELRSRAEARFGEISGVVESAKSLVEGLLTAVTDFYNFITGRVFSISVNFPSPPAWLTDLLNGNLPGSGGSSPSAGAQSATSATGGDFRSANNIGEAITGNGRNANGFTLNNYGDINNGMDLAAFDARVRRLMREEMGAR